MADSTLAITYDDLRNEVGHYLGKQRTFNTWTAATAYSLGAYVRPTTENGYVYVCTTAGTTGGTEPAAWPTEVNEEVDDNTATWTCLRWTPDDDEDIEQILRTGLRQFYFPRVLTELGERTPHMWTFLKPVDTLTTVADTGEYGLDANYGGVEGSIYFENDDAFDPICKTSVGEVEVARQNAGGSAGTPLVYAVRPKTSDYTGEQNYEIIFGPVPDQVFTLTYYPIVLLDRLTATKNHPWGGAQHAETIKESCLAAAERFKRDMSGQHQQLFDRFLVASIGMDRRLQIPHNHGRMRGQQRYYLKPRNILVTYP